jgi:hypothetical protein
VSPKTNLDLLVERYGARPLIYPHEAAAEFGRQLSVRAASEAASRGTLPVRSLKVGRRRMVRLVDLAAALDSFATAAGLPVQAAEAAREPARRGRPRLAHPEMLEGAAGVQEVRHG